jgi:hypothetical protein
MVAIQQLAGIRAELLLISDRLEEDPPPRRVEVEAMRTRIGEMRAECEAGEEAIV